MTQRSRAFPTSDPEEQRLREAWHEAGEGSRERDILTTLLGSYLWKRAEAQIAEDRRRHPKAKRNQPVDRSGTPTRHLP